MFSVKWWCYISFKNLYIQIIRFLRILFHNRLIDYRYPIYMYIWNEWTSQIFVRPRGFDPHSVRDEANSLRIPDGELLVHMRLMYCFTSSKDEHFKHFQAGDNLIILCYRPCQRSCIKHRHIVCYFFSAFSSQVSLAVHTGEENSWRLSFQWGIVPF